MERRRLAELIVDEFDKHVEGDISLSEEDLNWLINSPVDSSLKIYQAIKNRHPGTYLYSLDIDFNHCPPFSCKLFPKYLQLSEKFLEIITTLKATDRRENIDVHLVTPLQLGFKDIVNYDQFFHRAHRFGYVAMYLQTAILCATKPHQLYNWATFATYDSSQSPSFHEKEGKNILDIREVEESEPIGINTRWIFARRC